ncbi:MAG: glycosyltransferase family 2 protein [Rhodopila sp.]|jgi:glycosyltransferase involved in cell wall biosynthesis
MTVGITSIQQNRRPWIIEWIAFHLMVGFGKIIIYSHNSSDGTDEVVARLAARYPIVGYRLGDVEKPQLAAYRHSWDNHGNSIDWMAFIDGDEFLFPTRANTVAGALASFDSTSLSALAVYWKIYGSNGHVDDPGGLLVEKFPRHSSDDHDDNRHVKSIVRGGERIDGYTSHVFQTQRGTFDENMREVVFGKTGYAPTYVHFRINHYLCQSWEFFKKYKQNSGAPDVNPLMVRPDSWFHRVDRNECDDGVSHNFLLRLKLKVAELEAFLKQ